MVKWWRRVLLGRLCTSNCSLRISSQIRDCRICEKGASNQSSRQHDACCKTSIIRDHCHCRGNNHQNCYVAVLIVARRILTYYYHISNHINRCPCYVLATSLSWCVCVWVGAYVCHAHVWPSFSKEDSIPLLNQLIFEKDCITVNFEFRYNTRTWLWLFGSWEQS